MNDVDALLGVLLLFSNIFWAWNTQRLINKLMSRNYFEFKEADLKTDKKPKTMGAQPDFAPVDDMGQLSELMT